VRVDAEPVARVAKRNIPRGADMSFDWNRAAETTIVTSLEMIPEVGNIVGGLVSIFWPESGEDVWSEIEQQVEQLIQQNIDKLVYEQTESSLAGLKNNMTDYLDAVSSGDLPNISSTWITTDGDFDQQLPSFQAQGYEVLLLPLFAQFGNLNLALLRDGVLFGGSWGWNESYQQLIAQKLQKNISDYGAYGQRIYQQGLQNVIAKTGRNDHAAQPFRTVNTYQRQMTLGVLDFSQLWPYMDVSKYPQPVSVHLDREIYSDPVGTCDNSGLITLPSSPSEPISSLSVWAWDRIDGVQLTYPPGGGPGGVTVTPRMGDSGGGANTPPHGGVFNLAGNPIVVAGGLAGFILNAFTFTFADGTQTNKLGGNYPGGGPFAFSYDGEILSSVHINGISDFYGSADCVVFGFKYASNPDADVNALRRLYVGAPVASTVDELAASAGIDAPQLAPLAASEGWERLRERYWRRLRQRA
jgi:delta endotoxin, N-terminal domain